MNSLQDHYADLSNFLQQIDAGVLSIGDATIQWTKYAAGEARLSGAARFDGIARALGGLWAGQFADPASGLAAGKRPYGLTVFNTTKNRLEVNIGTDAAPSWASAARGLTNTDIDPAAAIAYSKLALTGSVTNADISAGAAIAKSKLAALAIVDADIAAGAAIAKSKLASLAIVDADVAAGAAISKSKLAALAIVNADVAAGAAIAVNKLAPGTNGQYLTTTGGVVAWGSASGVWAGSYPVVTGDLTDGAVTSVKIQDLTIVDADISTTAAIAWSKINAAGQIVNADISGTAGIAKGKLAALNIVNADVDPAAAIAKSKLAALNIVDADVSGSAAIAKSKLAALAIVDGDITGPISKSKLGALAIVNADVASGAAIALTKIEEVSPAGTSFPGAPYEGQRYTYLADGATSTVWEMRFRAAVSKWEYVGGSPIYFLRDANNATANTTTWQDTFVQVTAPFAGIYEIEFGAEVYGEQSNGEIGIQVGATAPMESETNTPPNSTVAQFGSTTAIGVGGERVDYLTTISRKMRVTVTSAATVLKLMLKSLSGTVNARRCWMTVRPVNR